MGQAKLNKSRNAEMDYKIAAADISGFAEAIRKLCTASSSKLGGDCMVHAQIMQSMLASEGIESKISVGNASWRVGDDDPEVISHMRDANYPYPENSFPYHVWLTSGSYIIDVTTYQLAMKAEQLDEIDGGLTHVTWCPDFLLVKKETVSSFSDTAQLLAGTYHYEEDQVTYNKIMKDLHPVDLDDLENAWTIYRNPGVNVIGLNHMKI